MFELQKAGACSARANVHQRHPCPAHGSCNISSHRNVRIPCANSLGLCESGATSLLAITYTHRVIGNWRNCHLQDSFAFLYLNRQAVGKRGTRKNSVAARTHVECRLQAFKS
eukprot:857606-Amphidinium_carterae.1